MPTRQVVLLGPQRLNPTLDAEIERLGIAGPVAAVTAGWQEREEEDGELRELLGGSVVNLALHRRAEAVFAEDTELAGAYRERQDELKALQSFYRFRLDPMLAPARALLERRRGPARWLAAERRASVAAVRALDRQHLLRVAGVHRRFEALWKPWQRPALARHRQEIGETLNGVSALAIAGGHVAVLLNRLRLFGVVELLGAQTVLAWSAGAMALTDRVVLFHDTPPQGAGNAEVLENGLGLVSKVVVLPHARHRLELDNPHRVALFARRFRPAVCVPFDEGARMVWEGESQHAGVNLRQLRRDGAVVSLASKDAR
jgi:hypothetical protein